jgi:hypothetical protein
MAEKFMRVLSKFPATILRSPLHGLISKEILVITFTGRKGRLTPLRSTTSAKVIRSL